MTGTLERSAEATVAAVVQRSLSDLPEDPAARAHERLNRLTSSFASSLALVAAMHNDRDWEHLTRADGTNYGSMAEVLRDVYDLSASMARRYVQGASKFFAPLDEIAVDGTRIAISSTDVASLGNDGLDEAVRIATEGLNGVYDPDESSDIISDAVEQAKDRKQGARSSPEQADWDAPEPDGMEFTPKGLEQDPLRFEDDLEGLDEEPHNAHHAPMTLEDDRDTIMNGAECYDTKEARQGLPGDLREVAEAVALLARMDTRVVASTIAYDTRGLLLLVEDGRRNLAHLRGLVECSPWFIAEVT